MNIPYYYNSGYDDDGVDIYTCLHCGDKMYVRSLYDPNFCPYCGVKYEGKKDNIGHDAKVRYEVCFTEYSYWAIEERTVEIWGEPAINQNWEEKSCYRNDVKQDVKKILAEKRRCEEQDLAEIKSQEADHERILNLMRIKNPNFDEEQAKNSNPMTSKSEFRIVRHMELRRHSIIVRKDIYLKKTGKELNEHKGRIPYGANMEITTGIKFLPDRRCVA